MGARSAGEKLLDKALARRATGVWRQIVQAG
jgi:hypothetical protein